MSRPNPLLQVEPQVNRTALPGKCLHALNGALEVRIRGSIAPQSLNYRATTGNVAGRRGCPAGSGRGD